jgi:hypothetical protein
VGTLPATAALLAKIREWAVDPEALCFPVNTTRGRAVLYPEDVPGRTDNELVAMIYAQLNAN